MAIGAGGAARHAVAAAAIGRPARGAAAMRRAGAADRPAAPPRRMRRRLRAALRLAVACCAGAPALAGAAEPCGELLTIDSHAGTTTRVVLAGPAPGSVAAAALALLPGGGGALDLDEAGCPRALTGNSLVRKIPLFHAAGFVTALVDAPSDHRGEDGLAGFRKSEAHAADLGRVIAALRARGHTRVWLVGTSRGAISAVNAAARLPAGAGADGLVLTSALMSGQPGARKAWVADTVFDLPLGAIRQPLLVVGHADDACVRSPPALMQRIAERVGSPLRQVVTVAGGSAATGRSGVEACEGRSPHGFLGQEAEVVAGIARFIGGGRY